MSEFLVFLVAQMESPVFAPWAAVARAVRAQFSLGLLRVLWGSCKEPGPDITALQEEILRSKAAFIFWPSLIQILPNSALTSVSVLSVLAKIEWGLKMGHEAAIRPR